MAVVSVPAEGRTIWDEAGIRRELAAVGVDYERWELDRVRTDASGDEVLAAFAAESQWDKSERSGLSAKQTAALAFQRVYLQQIGAEDDGRDSGHRSRDGGQPQSDRYDRFPDHGD